MKIVLKIARAELRTLFYSPVAWITIVIFFVLAGIQFVTPLVDGARIQAVELANSSGWGGFPGPLTLKVFLGTLGQALNYLYLFIPLLTMGTINREISSGTMKLLSSSPIRIREIVLGKYTGLMIFNLVLLSSLALLLFTGYFSIQHAEFKWFCSMLLGVWLLSCTYLAIGLFISCLTTYQIVAGIITFLIFALMSAMGGIGQQYDFVRDLTWFLSLSGRIEPFISGMITTRDVLYFILVIILFLGLALIKLKSVQESKKWTAVFSRYAIWFAVILVLGYFSSRPGYVGYLDVTRNKLNTIDSATQTVLKEMDGSPMTVTLYVNLIGPGISESLPEHRNQYIWYFWDRYTRFYPNIKWKYEYYYGLKETDSSFYQSFPNKTIHQIAEQIAKIFRVDFADFKKPDEITKIVDLSKEDEFRTLMELEYKGKKSFLRTFSAPLWPGEQVVSGSIRRLVRNKVPHVLFTTGHYERSPWRNGEREYGVLTNFQYDQRAMINIGIDADTVNLATAEVPANTDLLVVADPRSALNDTEHKKILQYIENGGNAIFYGEPEKQQMLNPVLNKLGVNLENGRLVSPGKDRLSDKFWIFMSEKGNMMSRNQAMLGFQRYRNMDGRAGAAFLGPTWLSYKDTAGFTAEPVMQLSGNKDIWVENGLYKEDSAKPTFSSAEGDLQKDKYVVGLSLTRTINNREQRIFVASDADFMSPLSPDGGSIELGIYSWLVYNENPVYTRLIVHEDTRLTIGRYEAVVLWYAYVYVLPGILLFMGTIILIRRRRK